MWYQSRNDQRQCLSSCANSFNHINIHIFQSSVLLTFWVCADSSGVFRLGWAQVLRSDRNENCYSVTFFFYLKTFHTVWNSVTTMHRCANTGLNFLFLFIREQFCISTVHGDFQSGAALQRGLGGVHTGHSAKTAGVLKWFI